MGLSTQTSLLLLSLQQMVFLVLVSTCCCKKASRRKESALSISRGDSVSPVGHILQYQLLIAFNSNTGTLNMSVVYTVVLF